MTDHRMNPEDVPDELIELANQAWRDAPQKRDAKPTRMRYALAAAWPHIRLQARQEIAHQIEAHADEHCDGSWWDGGIGRAAQIARGEYQP